jgi:putative ABC transport system permease protein
MRLPWRRREEELDEEIEGHLRMAIRERVERGETTEQARAATLREFGSVTLVKEVTREMWGWAWLVQFKQDLGFGLRMMRRNPGFTFVAVVALALGVGANTAIFSVVNTVLLRPLPFKDPSRLVVLWEDNTKQGFPRNSVSPANFADYRDQNQVFQGMAAFTPRSFNLTGEGEPERIDGLRVSANLLTLLGVTPQLGRPFTGEEDRPGAARAVILGDRLWRRRFGSDPSVVGKTVTLDGNGYTVVGVMPPGFQFRGAFPDAKDDLLVPLVFGPKEAASRGNHYLEAVARLKDGVTLEQARAEMTTIAERLQRQYPAYDSGIGAAVVPLHEQLVGDIRPALLVLMGSVVLVLLIACANVANLLLARAASRQREIATRVAIGASRTRLVRQFLAESLLLAAVGGVFGLLLSVWVMRAIKAFMPEDVSQVKSVTLDARVLGFTALLSLMTGLVFGLAPALQASNLNLNETLKEGGRDSASGNRGRRVRAALVVAEIAVSFVLLVGAGLLVNSFVRLRNVDPGFDYENLLTMRVELPPQRYQDRPRRSAFYTELLRRVEALPGVKSAAVTSPLPLIYDGDSMGVAIEGRPAPPPGQEPDIVTRVVSPHYFRAMGIRLLRGRELGDQDGPNSQPAAVISETMARRYWPGEDPIGKRVAPGSAREHGEWISVVGVAGDVRQSELGSEPKPQMYLPYEQSDEFVPRDLVVKTEGEPLALAPAVRGEVWGIDRHQPVSNVAAMQDLVSESLARQRFSVLLLGAFAGVALVLAAVGIYGVMSYSVAQRTHEIGVRMALGARPRDVLGLAVGQGLKLVLAGVVIGVASALAMTRVMASLLFQVSPADPATYAAISLTLAGVATAACLVPARRAAKVDPLIALRSG